MGQITDWKDRPGLVEGEAKSIGYYDGEAEEIEEVGVFFDGGPPVLNHE